MKTTPVFTPNIQTKAFEIALYAHRTQHRKTGERETTKRPYILHPMSLSVELYNVGYTDPVLHSAALLHDVVEDCSPEWSFDLLEQELSEFDEQSDEVISIVKELTDPVYGPKVSSAQKRLFKKDRIRSISHRAKTVLLVDILANIKDIVEFPIWDKHVEKAFLETQRKLVTTIQQTTPTTDEKFVNLMDLVFCYTNVDFIERKQHGN
jgi:(p)ppGpp synthase/HD superfamily hydrolase